MTEPVEERRGQPRELTCIPTNVESTTEDQPWVALIRDISTSGARLFTRVRYEVGEELDFVLYLGSDESASRQAKGKVVRCNLREGDRDVWVFDVGVEFDPSIEQYAAEISALNQRLGARD